MSHEIITDSEQIINFLNPQTSILYYLYKVSPWNN